MKTSSRQTSPNGKEKSMYSQAVFHASRSARQDSDLERMMTVTSGRRCYEQSGRYSPLSSLVKMLLASSRWYSPARRLRWDAQPLYSVRATTYTEKSNSSLLKPSVQTLSVKDTPSNRLLFRLVPSVRHTNGTECGSSPEGMFPHLLMTPCTMEFCEDPASMRARAKRNGYRNGTRYNSLLSQIVYSDMLPTPVTQGLKVCENGKQKFCPQELLPTPLAVEIQHSKRVQELRAKGGRTMGSRKNGEQRPNGLLDYLCFHGILPTPNAAEATHWSTSYNPSSQMGSGLTAMALNGMLPTPCAQNLKERGEKSKQKDLPEMFSKADWLLTPVASDGKRSMMTMSNLKAHKKPKAEQSNLAELIAHKVGGGTSQLSPLFVEEMMGYPLMYLVLPFLSPDGDRNP